MRRSLTIPSLTLVVGLAFAAASAVGGANAAARAAQNGGAAGGTVLAGSPESQQPWDDTAAGGTVLAGSPESQQPWDDTAGDDEWVVQARDEARALLGTPEDELGADVRVGRRGSESMMLTEDYVLGRMTVELDDAGAGYRVTAVTVELPDGPETVRG